MRRTVCVMTMADDDDDDRYDVCTLKLRRSTRCDLPVPKWDDNIHTHIHPVLTPTSGELVSNTISFRCRGASTASP